jgi:hypothetical protein
VVAVGLASAAIYTESREEVARKADLLPVVANAGGYVTVETRQDGVSILNRIRIN